MTDDSVPERESKSQRKRQMTALQKIGETLVDLPSAQLSEITLDPQLARAIDEARAITSHEAKRRQLQYIGKLMRHMDPEPIQQALDKIQHKNQHSRAELHHTERWRDKLILEGDTALNLFIQQFPNTDRQFLRQLVRNAQNDTKLARDSGASTQLFRFLRIILSK